MDGRAWLGERFEDSREHLWAVACRILGSPAEAQEALDEAQRLLNGSGSGGGPDLRAWLTTVVGRVCLDMLRRRRAAGQGLLEGPETDMPGCGGERHPHEELADAVGLALLTVLDALDPDERLAFVMHDLFGLPFDEIAPVMDRSAPAVRQLAGRARHRVRGEVPGSEPDLPGERGGVPGSEPDLPGERGGVPGSEPDLPGEGHELVAAFLTAARGGDFDGLLAVLDPDVVSLSDGRPGARGAPAVAQGASSFARIALTAQPALINGSPGVLAVQAEGTFRALTFRVAGGRITEIDVIDDPWRLRQLNLSLLS